MAFGGNFDKDDFSAPMAEINTTPLVDVMLVLLIIFLVTAPMLTQAIKLELPNEKAQTVDDEKPIMVSINANGEYYWDSTLISKKQLETKFSEAAKVNTQQPIHLRADKKTPYENVSHILAAAQRTGLTNIGFITQPD